MGRSSGRRWTAADIPDQRGRTAVVTGANSGLGFETARMLAARGAVVVLACRDEAKAAGAVDRIAAAVPGAELRTLALDLASPESVRRAARRLAEAHPRIDLLINNAGGVRTGYAATEEGREATFAVNHLGPFAFTGMVLDRMLDVPGSRVVTVSSIAHRRGTVDFDDLDCAADRYRSQPAYAQAKLANLLFTYELQRRLAAAGAATVALAAHPGNARTGFGRDMPSPSPRAARWGCPRSRRSPGPSTPRSCAATSPRGRPRGAGIWRSSCAASRRTRSTTRRRAPWGASNWPCSPV